MFDIAWGEFVVIAVVALIVIGPKELPAVLRAIGQWTTKIRRMAAEFQGQFQEALREAEMADLKKEVDNLNDTAKGFTSQFDDPADAPPGPASATAGGEEAFPVAAEHPAIAQMSPPTLSSPTGGGGNGAGDAADAPPVTPPAAQPPLSEGSGQKSSEGGVHS